MCSGGALHEVTAGADAGGTRGQASRRHAPLSDDDVSLSILRRNGTKYTLFFVGKYLKNEFLKVTLIYLTKKRSREFHGNVLL
jgi:hypothetical protein